MTSLIFWNEDVNETVKNEAKEQKGGFLRMLLGTYGARFLGNLLTSKGVKAKILGRGVIRADEGTIREWSINYNRWRNN